MYCPSCLVHVILSMATSALKWHKLLADLDSHVLAYVDMLNAAGINLFTARVLYQMHKTRQCAIWNRKVDSFFSHYKIIKKSIKLNKLLSVFWAHLWFLEYLLTNIAGAGYIKWDAWLDFSYIFFSAAYYSICSS